MHLPTSPAFTNPELTLRHGTEAAVLIICGDSVTITGVPISSFLIFADRLVSDDDVDSLDSHLVMGLLLKLGFLELELVN